MPPAPVRSPKHALDTVVFGSLAAAVLLLLYRFLVSGGTEPRLFDFHTFWLAGRAYLHGGDPYPRAIAGSIGHGSWFVYPAPAAAVFAPLGALPYSVAAGLMTVVLVAAAAGALWLVGVRDWRCYTLAFANVALLKALNLGTVTPLLMLAVAAVWRLRRHGLPLALAIAGAVLLKLFLWPLLVWAVATGRRRQAGQALLLGAAASVVAWLPIAGSAGRYPSLLHQLSVHEAWSGYGLPGLAAAAGATHGTAALVGTLAAPLAGLAVWALARRLPERRALAATVAVSVAASPIVWAHYLALATLCVALASPGLSAAWLAPLALWATPQQQAWASGWRILVALGVLAAAVARPRLRRTSAAGLVAAPRLGLGREDAL